MEYKEHEVLDIIKSCTSEDAEKVLMNWNNKKANTLLDSKKGNYPYFVYSFPVVLEAKKVATITLVSCYGGNLNSEKPDLMQKYFGHEQYQKSWWSFSHDTYLDCYFTVHEEFELPEVVKGFRVCEFKSKDSEGNEFRFTVSYGYPDEENKSYIWNQYTKGNCYRFDNQLNVQILDEIRKGWSLGEKINENINNRLNMIKIKVTQPTFLINLDNPTEVSYEPREGNWKDIIVSTYQHGFPEIKDDEILYVYKENRGYIHSLKQLKFMNNEKEKIEMDFETLPDAKLSDVDTIKYLFEKYVSTMERGKPNQRMANNLKTIIDMIQVKSLVINEQKQKFMNNEKYNQIVDEAYGNYAKFILSTENQNNKYEIVKVPCSKEEFIKTVKSNDDIVKKMGKKYCEEFSEKWGLKIEERELSLRERLKLAGYRDSVIIESVIKSKGEYFHKNKLDEKNIPTKLITITYNDETIEIYE